MAATLAFAAAGADAPDAPGPRVEAQRLVEVNELLARQIELAGGEAFYLLLDQRTGRLTLMLRGAALRSFRVLGLEIGFPRVGFWPRRPADEWQGRVFDHGELAPPRPLDRLVVVAPPPTPEGIESAVLIPPTPEEKYPVPSRYHVRYDGGLSLEVRTDEAAPPSNLWRRCWTALGHWWADARAALSGSSADRIRLRLVLGPDEARSFYRALPPGTRLLVLPLASSGD